MRISWVDELSDGRMVLGLGAGRGRDGEHRMVGYDFGDVPTRLTVCVGLRASLASA